MCQAVKTVFKDILRFQGLLGAHGRAHALHGAVGPAKAILQGYCPP